MDMKTLKEFMNSSNSIYLILPPVALWAVTPFFETGAMFAVCLGIAAIAFALLAVKDYYDDKAHKSVAENQAGSRQTACTI